MMRAEGLAGARRKVWRHFGSVMGLGALVACTGANPTPAFSLKIEREPKTPGRAMVTIDEQYVGTLAYVAARGVSLPTGEHRISVEHTGYFPYDEIIHAEGSKPVTIVVKMTPVPD